MPRHRGVVVLGGGGHGKVVISTLRHAGLEVEAAYDDDPRTRGRDVLGVPILGPIADAPDEPGQRCIVAIGANAARESVVKRLRQVTWISVCHPRSWVDGSASIGAGSVICAGAIVQADARIGDHVIVNTSASVDHDCVLDDFVHVAPGARLGGTVRVSSGALIGIGSSVLPGTRVGYGAVLGAGAALVRDLAPLATAVGVPARSR